MKNIKGICIVSSSWNNQPTNKQKNKKSPPSPPPCSSFSQIMCNSLLLPQFDSRNPILATHIPLQAHCHDLAWEKRGGREVTVQHPQYRNGGKTVPTHRTLLKVAVYWRRAYQCEVTKQLILDEAFRADSKLLSLISDRKNSMERKDVLSHPFVKSFPSL